MPNTYMIYYFMNAILRCLTGNIDILCDRGVFIVGLLLSLAVINLLLLRGVLSIYMI